MKKPESFTINQAAIKSYARSVIRGDFRFDEQTFVDEVLSRCLLAAWTHEQAKDLKNAMAFFKRIIVNRHRFLHKKWEREVKTESIDATDENGQKADFEDEHSEDDPEFQRTLREIRSVLKTRNPQILEVFEMRRRGSTYSSIAKELGITTARAEHRMHDAREAIKKSQVLDIISFSHNVPENRSEASGLP